MGYIIAGLGKCIVALLFAGLCIAYILSPIDLIPDLIPILGWTDDFMILVYFARFCFQAKVRHVVFWVIILPGISGFILWQIHMYLGLAVGSLFFLGGLWKIGQEIDF